MPEKPPKVTQADTIAALLERSKRAEVPIRKTFVQQGKGKVRIPGPLAALVTNHDERALDLYLLTVAAASADPFDVVLPATTWARALGLTARASSRSAVSKAFRRLEGLGLIARDRAGSRSRITLLDEGGHGDPYAHPATNRERYLKVPRSYWDGAWHLKVRLPGKTMLLIALSLDDDFPLPIEKGPDWYGISADTVQRGFDELARHKLLDVDARYKKAPLSPLGYTEDRHYTLKAPFGPLRRPLATVRKLRA